MKITSTLFNKPYSKGNLPVNFSSNPTIANDKSFELYPKAHVPLISKVSFGQRIPLEEIKGLPCPCTGLIMLTKKQINLFGEAVKNTVGRTLIQHLEPYVEQLPKVEEEITRTIIVLAEKNPSLPISKLVQLMHSSKATLEKEQKSILADLSKLSEELSSNLRPQIQSSINESLRLINYPKPGKTFQNKPLRIKIEEMLTEELKKNKYAWQYKNQSILKSMAQTAATLPSSDKSVNAFVIKYKGKINSIDNHKVASKNIAERLLSPLMSSQEHIEEKSAGGIDGLANHLIMSQRMNNLRGSMPYPEWLLIHPEMIVNAQKHVDVFIDKIFSGEIQGHSSYPQRIKDKLYERTNGIIELDISRMNEYIPKPKSQTFVPTKGLATEVPQLEEETVKIINADARTIQLSKIEAAKLEKEIKELKPKADELIQRGKSRDRLTRRIQTKQKFIMLYEEAASKRDYYYQQMKSATKPQKRIKYERKYHQSVSAGEQLKELTSAYEKLVSRLSKFDKAHPTVQSYKEQLAVLDNMVNAPVILRDDIAKTSSQIEKYRVRHAEIQKKLTAIKSNDVNIDVQYDLRSATETQKSLNSQITAIENRLRKNIDLVEARALNVKLVGLNQKMTENSDLLAKLRTQKQVQQVITQLLEEAVSCEKAMSALNSELLQKQSRYLRMPTLSNSQRGKIFAEIEHLTSEMKKQMSVIGAYKDKTERFAELTSLANS